MISLAPGERWKIRLGQLRDGRASGRREGGDNSFTSAMYDDLLHDNSWRYYGRFGALGVACEKEADETVCADARKLGMRVAKLCKKLHGTE